MQVFDLIEGDCQPGCREVRVVGELDLAVAGQLQELLEKAVDSHGQILIDLSTCEFIDSTGIATILQAHQRLAEKGGRLAIHGATDQVRRILAITGLTANGLVFESAEEALAAAVPDK
jgi:anti-sigma B factor antagonist